MSDETRFVEPWIRLARRRWRTGAVVFGVVVAVGLALLFLTRPVYRSEAALRLGEPPPSSGVNPSAGVLSFFQLGGDPFANDLELLGSRSLAEAVVDRMALNASLDAPAGWHRDSLLLELEAGHDTEEARFEVERLDDGAVEIRRVAPGDSLIGRVPPGVPASFGGITVAFQPAREDMPRRFALVTLPFREATRVTRSALAFERPRREANVVAIAYDDPDPGVANGVVGAAVESFIRLRTELHHRESTQAADSLRAVARETERELRVAEESLEALQRSRRMVAPTAQSEALVERQAELIAGLEQARATLHGLDQMLDRLGAVEDPSRSWTALLSYPTFLENETLGSMLLQLTELHAQREALATRRTPDNTELRLLDERIEYLDRSLREMAREYRAGLVDQIEATEPRVQELDRRLASLPGDALELSRRQREVRLLSEVLILTEQRLRQEELREALTHANVQVVDPPALRDRPVWPRKKLGLVVVLLLASGFGGLGMVVRDRSDPHVRRAADVERALGRPPLTVGPVEGATELDPAEVRLLAGRDGTGNEVVHMVPVNGTGPVPGIAGPRLRMGESIHGLRDAAALAAEGGPVVLVVEAGRTRRDELRRTAGWIEEAGGTVAGAILVLRTARDARIAWE